MEYHSGGSLPLLGRPRYCPGANANGGYLCESGHCCGESGCCTYYYELWWFWLLWTVLILFSCCCAYRHRRAKLRVQQQQRQREISLLAYHGANSYPSSMLDLSFLASLKLPSYEEVAAQPSTPPPPYSSVFTAPRYPQPPRAADPHLLTQHGPLLHRPLSDGPSSLSSDNSSSCSCDSCCPSSPCSSSLSAPVTYETDTSHASTPSEAAPLALDVTMETIAAAASCLEVSESRLASKAAPLGVSVGDAEDTETQKTATTDSLAPNQTVTVAVVTRAASPQLSPSPGSDMVLPLGITPPTKQQLDLTPCTSTCSSSILPSVNIVDAPLPSVQVLNIEGPTQGLESTPAVKTTSPLIPSPQAESTCPRPGLNLPLETLSPTRTCGTTTAPSSPTIARSPEVERTLAQITESPGPSLVPTPAPSNLTVTVLVPTNQPGDAAPSTVTQSQELVLSSLSSEPDPQTKSTLVPATDKAATSPGASLSLAPLSCASDVPQYPQRVASLEALYQDPATSSLFSVLDQLSVSSIIGALPSKDQGDSGSGSGDGSSVASPSAPATAFAFATSISASTCPAITIESESVFAPVQSPNSALSSPSSLPSPPFPSNATPGLLLDPLNALHPSDKGGSSSGHASSLSPSPRTTQSPPKQTLFSPCVDIFEPGPPNWEVDEEDEEQEDDEDEDDEDVGADESQYRHRRLTGDSGIEVCRCRVEEDDKDEEEEEEEEKKKVTEKLRGGERDMKGGGSAGLHDSVDCPARGQVTTGEEMEQCNSTGTPTPSSEDGSEVVIVMESV